MQIVVFDRNGRPWADYVVPPGVKATRLIPLSDEASIRKVIATESGRVKALAERALLESVPGSVLPVEPIKLGLVARIKRAMGL